MKRSRRAQTFLPPPHPNADAHERFVAAFRRMTQAERFQTIVDAGICTPDGKFTAPYTSDEPSMRHPETWKGARPRRASKTASKQARKSAANG